MAPALWPCVSRILWLACLLPLAPAGVAAGKALHGPAARPPQAVVRPGASPGAGVAELASCALRAPFSSPESLHRSAEGTEPAGRREALSSLPSLLSPEVASPLEGIPCAPRFLLPPPRSALPWESRAVARASIPIFGELAAVGGGGGQYGETENMPGPSSRRSPPGSAVTLPAQRQCSP